MLPASADGNLWNFFLIVILCVFIWLWIKLQPLGILNGKYIFLSLPTLYKVSISSWMADFLAGLVCWWYFISWLKIEGNQLGNGCSIPARDYLPWKLF